MIGLVLHDPTQYNGYFYVLCRSNARCIEKAFSILENRFRHEGLPEELTAYMSVQIANNTFTAAKTATKNTLVITKDNIDKKVWNESIVYLGEGFKDDPDLFEAVKRKAKKMVPLHLDKGTVQKKWKDILAKKLEDKLEKMKQSRRPLPKFTPRKKKEDATTKDSK